MAQAAKVARHRGQVLALQAAYPVRLQHQPQAAVPGRSAAGRKRQTTQTRHDRRQTRVPAPRPDPTRSHGPPSWRARRAPSSIRCGHIIPGELPPPGERPGSFTYLREPSRIYLLT